MTNKLDDKARLLQKLTTDLGWNIDYSTLLTRINQLDKGLIQEDEFIYFLNWSKKFKLIHKLDQNQIPTSSKDDFRPPDLLVIQNDNGIDKPYLIEIKTTEKKHLSWSEKYYKSLVNYSVALNIPLLIAWKWNAFDLWTLFEISEFEKPSSNYKIDIAKAHKKSLLSKLAGDYIINGHEGFSLNFKYKKTKVISESDSKKEYKAKLDSFFYIGEDKKHIQSYNPAYIPLILSQFPEEITEMDSEYIYTKFQPNNNSFFAQSLIIKLTKGLYHSSNVNWIELAKENKYPLVYDDYLKLLSSGYEEKIIKQIYFIDPSI